MKKVNSINEYYELVNLNKERTGPHRTNCFLMPSAIEDFISEGRFSVDEFDDGLVFYLDEGGYYLLYYFWSKEKPFGDLHADKDMIIEELNNRERRSEYLSQFEEEIGVRGFMPFKTNIRLVLNLSEEHDNLEMIYNKYKERLDEGLTVSVCTDDLEYAKAVELWDERLQLGDVPMKHRKRYPGDQVFLVHDAEKLVACNWWHTSGKSAEFRHTVSHKDYSGKGLGTLVLVGSYLKAYDEGARMAYGWVEENNEVSMAFQKKLGNVANGQISKQYIKKAN